MKKGFSTIIILMILVVLTVGVIGFLRFGLIRGEKKIENQNKAVGPKEVVENFYQWYLSQANGLDDLANRNELADAYKLKIKEFRTSASGGGFDPVLMAQDKPRTLEVGTATIEGTIARVQVDENFGETTNSLLVALQQQENSWLITDIQTLSTTTPLKPKETRQAVVYFTNPTRANGATDCSVVYGVERTVSQDATYAEILNHLFMGPTMSERQQGYVSLFSKQTTAILKSVKVVGATAYVDFIDIRNIIPNASASCGGQEFLAEVGKTLKHDRKINQVIYAIEGKPETFYEWMQLGCQPENNNCDPTPFKE